jgi:isopentenyldiphosphate isomerase
MEWLDEVDASGEPTGRVFERAYVHANGIRHRTSHVWIVRDRDGEKEILLQKRSMTKDSFPGDYDISSAGHIPAGSGFAESALRELKEELGLDAREEDLIMIDDLAIQNELVFYGKPFRDSQISRVYYLQLDVEPDQLTLQQSEVDSVMWIGLEECIKRTKNGEFPCLFPDELKMLKDTFST